MVITIDLRNHGHSPHRVGMSYKQMALDIIDIIQYEKLTRIDLLGHSMGGKVAMWLALHYPVLISKLIVVDIAPKTYPLWHQKILAIMQKAPLSSFQSRQQIDHYLARFIEDESERAFIAKNLLRKQEGGYHWRCNLTEIITSYLKIAAFPASTLIFSNPTLFLRGENSHYIMRKDYSLITSLFTLSEIHSIAHSDHLPHIEQPDAFYQQVQLFLN
jgi:esterase